MFRSVRHRDTSDSDAGVDMAPLIDVVFILLIFFLVTTTFVHDRGLVVTRPDAVAASSIASKTLRIELDEQGHAMIEGRRVVRSEVRAAVIAFVAANRNAAVVVAPVRQTPAGRLMDVVNVARGAGATDVAVATQVER